MELLLAAAALALFFACGLHQIREGYVGVYWRGGALMEYMQSPGYHWKIPVLDSHSEVQVTMQTDSVQNIPCGTSGGVLVSFGRVEVVNRLDQASVLTTIRQYGVDYDKIWIFDKIHHEVNQFCSRHSLQEVYIDKFDTLDELLQSALQSQLDQHKTGVQILAVRVTKPLIPEEIRKNYEAIEAEKTRARIAKEHEVVVLQQAETESRKQQIDAEREKSVREIQMNREVMEQQKLAEMDAIKSAAEVKRIRERADADAYSAEQLAEANKRLLTPEHLSALFAQAIANNTKIYFGEKIPQMFVEPGAAVLGQR